MVYRPIEDFSNFYSKNNTNNGVSKAKRKKIYARDNNQCIECGSREDLTIDHVFPRSKGGSNNEANLQTMCKDCNSKKADKVY